MFDRFVRAQQSLFSFNLRNWVVLKVKKIIAKRLKSETVLNHPKPRNTGSGDELDFAEVCL